MQDVKLFRYFVWIAFVQAALSSCGARTSSGRIQGVATDLPDDGGQNTIHLYWIDDDRIFRGECLDRVDLLRSKCLNNLEVMSYGLFKTKLERNLGLTIADLLKELAETNSAMAKLQAEINDLVHQIEDLQAKQHADQANLATLKSQLQAATKLVDEYQQQLTLIRIELNRRPDTDLVDQAAEMAGRMAEIRAAGERLAEQMAPIAANIQRLGAAIEALKNVLPSFMTRLDNLKIDHQRIAAELKLAQSDLSVYQDTLARLEDRIDYWVLSDNTYYQAVRKFVKRFDVVFASQRGSVP